jgi:hypothetical protein
MALITLTTVRGIVRKRGDFQRSKVYTDDYLDDEIQAAWSACHRVVEEVHEGFFDREGTVSTVASRAWVALPTDCRKVKGIDLLDGTEYRELRQLPIGARHQYGQATDEPDAYRLTERGVDLFPTPNAVYTLRVTYGRKVMPLSGAGVEVDEEWQDFVVWKAIVAIATSQERSTGEYERQMDRAEMAIRSGASGRRQQEPEYLILREYGPTWGNGIY